MTAIRMLAALGAAASLAGSAWAADETPAGGGRLATADAAPGLLVQRHVSDEKLKEQVQTFFDENGKRAGIVSLPSGLQYQVVRSGSGPRPGTDSLVRINYTGSLLDGTEFGASNRDGKGLPAEFPIAKLIPGLRDAVSRMEQGAKWRIYVPPQLGYSLHNPLFRKITIFDVELVSVAAPATAVSGVDSSAHELQVVGLR